MSGKLNTCKTCGKEIAKTAKVCPHCGAKNKKPLWVFLLIAGAVIAGGALLSKGAGSPGATASSPASSPEAASKQAQPKEPAIEISPEQLYAEYEANTVKADSQYKGKTLKITGTVESIDKDILDVPYVTLGTGELFANIQVYFTKSEQTKLADLTKGQTVTIIGTCDGKTTIDVSIKNSVLAE